MLSNLKKCLSFIDRATTWQAVGVAVLMLTGALLEAMGIGLIFPFIKLITDPSLIYESKWIEMIYGAVPPASENDFLALAAASLLGVFTIKNIVLLLVYYGQARFVAFNEAALAERILGNYLKGAYFLHLSRNSAESIRTITSAIHGVFRSGLMGYATLASEFILVSTLIVILFAVEPWITLGAAVTLGLVVGAFYASFKNRFTAWGKREQELNKQILQSLQQGLHSIKEVKILGREDFIIGGFSRTRRELSSIAVKVITMNQAPRLWVETVTVTGVLLVVIYILLNGGNPGTSLAVLTLFAAAAFRLIPSMNRIIIAMNGIKNSTHSINLIDDDIRVFQAHSDESAATGGKDFLFSGSLRVEGISFSYPGTDATVLKNIDFTLHKGESLGLVGPSGAGKTTLADIILGLLVPTEGHIMVDGIDISRTQRVWQNHIGYVPQSIYLTDDTLRRNIAFGLSDDEIDEEKVMNAVNLAQLDDLVGKLPNGLDTPLGEHGIRLSGGQAQRTGIARALYGDPDVLVFDEATSSLDSETEHEISTAVERLRGEKTLIIIAHRLSTVRKCDRLLFLKDGEVADSGGFKEMAARNAEFNRLVELSQL